MDKQFRVSLPQLALVGATRAAIGVGAGLLISNRLNARQRKSVGLPLLVLGLLSTIPIAAHLFRGKQVPSAT
jgi:hypothetical protein